MDSETFRKACEGKSAANGGLNLGDFRAQLTTRFPDQAEEIKNASRHQLNELAQSWVKEELKNPVIGTKSMGSSKTKEKHTSIDRLVNFIGSTFNEYDLE